MARLALLLASLLVLAACGGESGDEGSPAATSALSDQGVSLAGQTLDGESLSLDSYRGKPVFVNVWASW
jgi:ABC-type glycerol-3-phosphate transport system substrate-binding protein